ncbi:MAG: hypothetical protein BA871_07630 [Desulfuromonadales bacterium C00003096]|nr:MAG: hypothetical protein BA871_07630 [Desulfuromonadales bacterium C00003096]
MQMWTINSLSIVRCKMGKRGIYNFGICMWWSIKIKTDKNNYRLVTLLISAFCKPDSSSANIYQEIFMLILRNNGDI